MVLRPAGPVLLRLASEVACGLVAGFAVMFTAAGAASAAGVTSGCDPTETQPFLPWSDPAEYVLAPGGTFEPDTTPWVLRGGAAIVGGNETYYVHSTTDRHSLSLPSGSSAETAKVCLGLTSPTIRFFAVNTGSSAALLEIVVYFRSGVGTLLGSAPVATIAATGRWHPTTPIPAFGNATAPVGTAYVQFKFKPVGSGSGWRIDDVYVDPWLSRIPEPGP
jgi:hypothetical protein